MNKFKTIKRIQRNKKIILMNYKINFHKFKMKKTDC